jgi:hypothetical protein
MSKDNLEQRKSVFKAPQGPPLGMSKDEWTDFILTELEIAAVEEPPYEP